MHPEIPIHDYVVDYQYRHQTVHIVQLAGVQSIAAEYPQLEPHQAGEGGHVAYPVNQKCRRLPSGAGRIRHVRCQVDEGSAGEIHLTGQRI